MLSPYAREYPGFMGHEVYAMLETLFEKKECNTTNTKLGAGSRKRLMQDLCFIGSILNLPLVNLPSLPLCNTLNMRSVIKMMTVSL